MCLAPPSVVPACGDPGLRVVAWPALAAVRGGCAVMSGVPIKLIVGLGNPGPEYARTRHNAGFWLVDELARRLNGNLRNDSRHQGELAKVQIAGNEVWLLKPKTFMNRSGGPTQSVAN